ncbi:MAG: hypothetical protein ACP5OB_08175 [Candidatus Ratteibacteria bacterium]
MISGYGEKIINPPMTCHLSGYGFYLERFPENILDDLKVRVVFIKDKKENSILLSSFDLIGFSVEFSDKLRREISEKFNLPFKNILISCIHTHSGPATIFLRGAGEINFDYMGFLKERLKEATEEAIKNGEETEIKWNIKEIEPIGFNRVKWSLEPIDLNLGIIVLNKKREKTYIVNYSCHPVTLGINKEISADFPGRIIKEIEKKGNKGIFFQGFCGDIDPFVNKIKWGSGEEKDIDFYGKHISDRVFKIEQEAFSLKKEEIRCYEKRINLPLEVKEEIKEEKNELLKNTKNENFIKWVENWYEETKEKLPELLKNPYIKNIPVWTGEIGEIKIIGYPGEVFCEIGLKLRKKYGPLFLFGYSNGDIGYIPTKKAYKNKKDYACYLAPKVYNYFPFKSEIEKIFLKETKKMFKKGKKWENLQ